MGGWVGGWVGGAAGEIENKAISASNLKLKLKLTEAELGNKYWVTSCQHLFQVSDRHQDMKFIEEPKHCIVFVSLPYYRLELC